MLKREKKKIIIISGATASGKSKLALDFINPKIKNKILEKILEKKNDSEKIIEKVKNSEIISADSRQVYKNIPIFSGILENEKNIKLTSFLEETENFSAGDFEKLSETEIKKIWNKNKIPIIVGGTSFYFKSLLYENFLPKVEINKELRLKLENKNLAELLLILKKLDSERLKTIDKNNKPRIIRSIEIATELGKVPPLSEKIKDNFETFFIWINIDREKQKEKISENFKKRMKNNFLEEAKNLKNYFQKKCFSEKEIKNRFFKIGLSYKFIFDFWENKISKDEFIKLGILEEQKYAKRQNTYLKKFYNNLPDKIFKIKIEK